MTNKQQLENQQQAWLQQQKKSLLSNTDTPVEDKNNEAQISANYAVLLLQTLQQLGFDSQALKQALLHKQPELEQARALIPYHDYAQLVLGALNLSNNPHLGLLFGQRLNLSTHGLLGFAVMSSPNLAKAAELAQTYIKIRNQLIDIEFSSLSTAQEPNAQAIHFNCRIEQEALFRFEIETSLSSLYQVWLSLFGSSQGLGSVYLNYQPEAIAHFKQIFQIPIYCGQNSNSLSFDGDFFSQLNRVTDTALTELAQQQCQQLLTQLEQPRQSPSQPLIDNVREIILSHKGFADQQQTAAKLNISSRSLARQLAAQGSSFGQILTQLRQQLARLCLSTTDWSIEDISALLDYSDSSNFNRAFKRWYGLSASAYRHQGLPKH